MSSAMNESSNTPQAMDYETIWLHMKERFWTRALVLAGFALAAGGLLGYGLSTTALEALVIRYTQTDEFRTKVASVAQSHVPLLAEEVSKLEAREQVISEKLVARQREIEALESLPVTISDHSLEWRTTSGHQFHLEHGEIKDAYARTGQNEVVFESPFSTPPTVVLTPYQSPMARMRFPFAVDKVTTTGFTIAGGEDSWDHRVAWIAVGN